MKELNSHLGRILLAINIARIYFILSTTGYAILLAVTLASQNQLISEVVRNNFFQESLNLPAAWIGITFLVIVIALNIFLISRFGIALKIIRKYMAGEFFGSEQSTNLTKVGKGFDYYSYLWYASNLIFGVFFFNDLTSFYKTLPYAIIFFLLGKIVLIIGAISSEGTFLKEENDLTV